MARIPVRISSRKYRSKQNKHNADNLITVKLSKPGPPAPKIIPKCLVINARSLAKLCAASALNGEISTNNIDTCLISETWLNNKIPSSSICPNGYILVRKYRCNSQPGGGVAILCRSNWKAKNLNFSQNNLECLWCKIQTVNIIYYVAVVYHPPDPVYPESELLDHLSES